MTEHKGEQVAVQSNGMVMIVTTGSTSVPPHPCTVGRHRWAYLTNGRQACGHCGVKR